MKTFPFLLILFITLNSQKLLLILLKLWINVYWIISLF